MLIKNIYTILIKLNNQNILMYIVKIHEVEIIYTGYTLKKLTGGCVPMAITQADIVAIKDRIPPQFKPAEYHTSSAEFTENAADTGAARPIATVNLSLDAPDDPVSTPHRIEREQIKQDIFIGMKDMADGQDVVALNTGRQARVVSGGSENAKEAKLRRNRASGGDLLTHLLLQQQLDAAIAANNEQIARNNQRLAVLDRYQTGLERHLDKLDSGEEIELNEDGSLKNADAEAAIREYEDKYGVKVDRTDLDSVRHVLRGVQAETDFIRRDNERLEQENREYAALGRELDRNPDDPALHDRIEQKLQTESGTREVAKAATEAATIEGKQVVHDKTVESAQDADLKSDLIATGTGLQDEIDPFALPTTDQNLSFASDLEDSPIRGGNLSADFETASAEDGDEAAPDNDHQPADITPATGPSNTV